ncbi:uncharacterized protein VTP21DRAFT_6706 [Calcarisporiella thermophila]|uniref:uncharacterized protein n=1 Tax=Calcarisporiella thermophila TaxID=911321 RepID=UPI00374281A6
MVQALCFFGGRCQGAILVGRFSVAREPNPSMFPEDAPSTSTAVMLSQAHSMAGSGPARPGSRARLRLVRPGKREAPQWCSINLFQGATPNGRQRVGMCPMLAEVMALPPSASISAPLETGGSDSRLAWSNWRPRSDGRAIARLDSRPPEAGKRPLSALANPGHLIGRWLGSLPLLILGLGASLAAVSPQLPPRPPPHRCPSFRKLQRHCRTPDPSHLFNISAVSLPLFSLFWLDLD